MPLDMSSLQVNKTLKLVWSQGRSGRPVGKGEKGLRADPPIHPHGIYLCIS